MAFSRNILKEINKWREKDSRKPLVLRGARQTGKTVAVEIFAKSFQNFINLNLERDTDKKIFEESRSIDDVIRGIELYKGKNPRAKETLLFIDEIQNSEKAIRYLRFFYEDYPELFVVAAGSLLEAVMMKEGFSFPVGRIEFLYLHPVTFDEYLLATGREKIARELEEVSLDRPPSSILHQLACEAFNEYVIVGGMPAVVADFIERRSFKDIADLKEDLITALKDDVAKYSRVSEGKYLRHVIEHAPYYVGERIAYEKFGNSEFRSREIKRTFELLEYAMIVQRVYGSSSTSLPVQPSFSVAPKILYLDAGLVIQKLGVSYESVSVADLNSVFRGKLSEQIVGQAFLAQKSHQRMSPCFWYRNKAGSMAETDFVYVLGDELLPIEVKSGKGGSLKSLHQFMLAAPVDKGIRFYSGTLTVDKVKATDKQFRLISIPFYLQWRLDELIEK